MRRSRHVATPANAPDECICCICKCIRRHVRPCDNARSAVGPDGAVRRVPPRPRLFLPPGPSVCLSPRRTRFCHPGCPYGPPSPPIFRCCRPGWTGRALAGAGAAGPPVAAGVAAQPSGAGWLPVVRGGWAPGRLPVLQRGALPGPGRPGRLRSSGGMTARTPPRRWRRAARCWPTGAARTGSGNCCWRRRWSTPPRRHRIRRGRLRPVVPHAGALLQAPGLKPATGAATSSCGRDAWGKSGLSA